MKSELSNLNAGELRLLFSILEKLSRSHDQNILRKCISEDLLCLLEADFLASFIWNQDRQVFENVVFLNMSPANIRSYDSYYRSCDPITPLLQKRRRATPTGFSIVLAECIYLMENYLKAFNPKATIAEYLNQMGPDVKGVLGSQIGTPESKPVPGYAYAKSVREDRNKMISGFEEAMLGVDALLLPTTPLPASKIGEDVETDLEGKKVNTFMTFIRDCDPVSVVGYPAITVPAGYSSTGLPIGLQIVARPFEEPKLLQIAHAFEQTTKVRKPPTL